MPLGRRHARSTAFTAAACYVALVTVVSLAAGATGEQDGWAAPLYLATFPGSTLVTVLVYVLASAMGAETSMAEHTPGTFDLLIPLAGGALVNVLLIWGAVAFARHFAREARAAHDLRRTARRGD